MGTMLTGTEMLDEGNAGGISTVGMSARDSMRSVSPGSAGATIRAVRRASMRS